MTFFASMSRRWPVPRLRRSLFGVFEKVKWCFAKALACFTLGRYLQNLIVIARDLDDPVRGKELKKWYGQERVRQIRTELDFAARHLS